MNCSTCSGSPASTATYTVGDVRPAAVSIIPSDAHAVVSATYEVVAAYEVEQSNGNCSVGVMPAAPDTGAPYTVPPTSNVKTPLITWGVVGEFTVRYALTWDDGVIDNSVTQTIVVVALGG